MHQAPELSGQAFPPGQAPVTAATSTPAATSASLAPLYNDDFLSAAHFTAKHSSAGKGMFQNSVSEGYEFMHFSKSSNLVCVSDV